jgi:hypothetical protein
MGLKDKVRSLRLWKEPEMQIWQEDMLTALDAPLLTEDAISWLLSSPPAMCIAPSICS